LRAAIRAGQLPGRTVGRGLRIYRPHLDYYVAHQFSEGNQLVQLLPTTAQKGLHGNPDGADSVLLGAVRESAAGA
jgi:hypothetical protein